MTTYEEQRQIVLRRLSLSAQRLAKFTQECEGTELGLSTLDNGTSFKRIDVSFKELVTDVSGFIETIYERFFPDLPGPTPEAKAKFMNYLRKNEEKNISSQEKRKEHFRKEEASYFTEYNDLFSKNDHP